MVQTTGDLVIVITPLSDILPAKMAEYNYLTILQRSQYYDLVKIVANEAGCFYLRVDTYKTFVECYVLKRILQQSGNVTDLLFDELK